MVVVLRVHCGQLISRWLPQRARSGHPYLRTRSMDNSRPGPPTRRVTHPATHPQQTYSRAQRTFCWICSRPDCRLRTHARYADHARLSGQGVRTHDLMSLLSSSFASSYSFNPLSVAIQYVCGELQIDGGGQELSSTSSLPEAMNKLIAHDIARNTPFTDPAPHGLPEVAGEWLVAASVDELACISTLHLWLLIECTNTQKPSLERHASKLNTLFLELLRKRVEEGTVTTGTIFAASNHLATCLIFFEQSNSQREVMMNGLEALVNAQGGFEKLTDSANPGLLQSLLWSDIMYSYFTGSMPRFALRSPPTMPLSLIPERAATSVLPIMYQSCCSPELLDTARHLKLFLLFRHGTETRALTKDEYQFLVILERYIHKQLLDQSGWYHNTATINEVIALALSATRMSVLCVWEQHRQLRRMIRLRLKQALSRTSFAQWIDADAINPLTWACWVLLTISNGDKSAATVAGDLLKSALRWLDVGLVKTRDEWETFFSVTAQPLLWHDDWKVHVEKIVRFINGDVKMQD